MRLAAAVPPVPASVDEGWNLVSALLPPGPELKSVARTTGALIREREVNGVEGLLRMALCYGLCNLSLKATATWCRFNLAASMTKWGVLHRLRNCGDWLLELVSRLLADQLPSIPLGGYRLRLVDASRVAPQGSKGESFRIHALFDAFSSRLVDLQLTGDEGGERLDRFAYSPGDLVIGDRVYATRRGLAHVAGLGAEFLVRTNAHNVPLQNADGTSVDLWRFLRGLADEVPGELDVQTQPDSRHGIPAVACRLVAVRKSEQATATARAKVCAEAKRKGREPSELTLEACGYVMLLTSAPRSRLNSTTVLELYRVRWQIELAFKRMKSLLNVDTLRTKDSRLAKTALAAKLLGVLLVEKLATEAGTVANWAFTDLAGRALCSLIQGTGAAMSFLADPAQPLNWLKEAPRARKQQRQKLAELLPVCS